ncbi:TRAP transporter small permease subunit [Acuticoccus mangrovi]|uniref:TRAP transporter small permease subunit n=1 Tax=Acuticoccus mangrovi TaxID=2796142 RepID=UPI002FC6A455
MTNLIDRGNILLGEILKWCLPVIVVLGAAVAILRYAFSLGRPWLSESFVWLNAGVILLGTASVLATEGHVRVDLLYRRMGPKAKAVVNLFGTVIFLWPFTVIVAHAAWPGVVRSWRLMEGSASIDGLPFLYLIKTGIIVFCVLLALQGIVTVVRSLAVLRGTAEPRPEVETEPADRPL